MGTQMPSVLVLASRVGREEWMEFKGLFGSVNQRNSCCLWVYLDAVLFFCSPF